MALVEFVRALIEGFYDGGSMFVNEGLDTSTSVVDRCEDERQTVLAILL